MMSGLTQQQQKGKSGFWMGRRGCTVATSRENGSGGGGVESLYVFREEKDQVAVRFFHKDRRSSIMKKEYSY